MIYTIWDIEGRNIVDAYTTEAEALADVRDAVKRFGPDAVRPWALAEKDEDGTITPIAEGEALIDRAFSVPA